MNIGIVVRPAVTATAQTVHRARESTACLPGLHRKPRIVRRWLASARAAQVALALVIVFLAVVHPRVRDSVLDAIGPRKDFGDHVAGIFGASSPSERFRERGVRIFDAASAAGCVGIVLVLLFAHLPVAVARSAGDAREKEREADAVAASSPARSAMLYWTAVALVLDGDHETGLKRKIAGLTRPDASRADAARTLADASATTVRPDTPPPPAAVPPNAAVARRYAIIERIGRGANGVVYRAHDNVLDRDVALKQLPAVAHDDAALQRLQREARVLAMLSHPNIVQVYDLAEHDGCLWMAMELVDRGDLAAHLQRHGMLPIPDAALLAARIADALDFAHGRGVIHRDLKPLNILMADDRTPKVTDFGLAKLSAATVHTVEGTVMGSPHYMSPEQADGRHVDNRCDVYSLGVIIYRMISGVVPFEGDLASVLAQHIHKQPVPLSRRLERPIDPDLDGLVLSMLAKSPDERPGSMAAVAGRLQRFAEAPAAR